MRSNRRSGACSTPSPTSSSWPPASSCSSPTRPSQGWALWAAIVILCREILVSGLREFLAELKVGVPVSRVAKWKTTVQLVAVGFLIAGPAGETVLPGTIDDRHRLLWVAAILTLYTGWDYLKTGIHHLVDED